MGNTCVSRLSLTCQTLNNQQNKKLERTLWLELFCVSSVKTIIH
jgi:hypothetical protein